MYNFVGKQVWILTENRMLRSFTALFVILALLFTAAVVPTPVARAETAQMMQIGFVNGSGVNIRKDAGTSYASLGSLSYAYVYVYGGVQASDGYEWKKIIYTDSNGKTTEGYIRSDFIITLSAGNGTDKSFEEQMADFPTDYQKGLRELHEIYPNWTFEADYVHCTFEEALNAMDTFPKKLVPSSYSISLRSMGVDAYNWSTGKWNLTEGTWVGASREVIAYYLDPRNFLNKTDIYMFSSLGYVKNAHTAAGLQTIIKGTFLENGFSDKSDYNGSYTDIIMTAAEQSGISPYMIASTIKQEQGSAGASDLISGTYPGYKDYYNFFNVGATGDTSAEVILNGLKYAKSAGWNSRSKAIIGGARWLANGYFSRGQNTYYYKNFDVRTGRFQYNYAQNIYDSKSSSASLRALYIGDTSSKLHFLIPVYKDMWDEPAPKPVENDKKNNYYFTSLGVSGFSMYKEQYSISVSGNTNISYSVPSGASYAGPTSFSLKQGKNTVELTVKAETGATNVYTLTVTASKACTLTIGGGTSAPTTSVIKGDANGDRNINAVDSALIRLHILKRKILTGDALKGADVNGDGNINAIDSALVRLHILGRKTIEQ